MGQSPSELSHTADTSARAKWKAGGRARRLRIGTKKKGRGEDLKKNPMKSNVLSCLGRRKRESSRAEAGGECEAGDPTTLRHHRTGKLPRDEAVSTVAGRRVPSAGSEASLGPDAEEIHPAASPRTAAGPSDAAGSGTLTAEAGAAAAGCEEPKHAREDNASEPPASAMEEQPLGGDSRDPAVPEAGGLITGSDPRTEPTSASSASDQHFGQNLLADDPAEAKMTKSECGDAARSPEAPDDPRKCSAPAERRKSPDRASRGPPAGQSYPGTIPKLIITRDPSPTPSQETPGVLSARTELGTGSCLDSHGDDESPCSDSGCGGSPALMRSPRKLSNSSSIGLSSASSFEESEDDFTGSDIESSLSPARSLCSPDDGPGVSDPFKPTPRFTCGRHRYRDAPKVIKTQGARSIYAPV